MRDKLIAAGVKNLREFGYPQCTKDNVLTDMIYRRFFLSMLKDQGPQPKAVQDAIDGLIAACSSNKEDQTQ
jgi:hypothetical protein